MTKTEITRETLYQRFFNWLIKKDSNADYGIKLDQSNEEYYVFISNDWWELKEKYPKLDDWFFNHMDMDYSTQGGAYMVFPDEYSTCTDCGQIVRHSPDSYDWEPQYVDFECDRICRTCIEDDVECLIDEFKNQHTRAIPEWAQKLIKNAGYVCMDDENTESCSIFESGLHLYQDDDPEEIIKGLEKDGYLSKYDYIFTINSRSQFTIQFSLWLREKEA